MFSEIPKLFDRNFAIGYFLPAVIVIGLGIQIINWFHLGPNLINYLEANLIIGTTLIGLLSWLGGYLSSAFQPVFVSFS